VGHTQNRVIKSLYGGKIIGTDTSNDREHPGEILLYKDGILYRCLYTGQRIVIGGGQ
jgi:hypothetical protein